jgi:hypothetical protein
MQPAGLITWAGCSNGLRIASHGWIFQGFSNAVLKMSNVQLSKQNALADPESQILAWPGISKHLYSHGGTEFRFGGAEVGHLHDGGTLDVPLATFIMRSRGKMRISYGQLLGYGSFNFESM